MAIVGQSKTASSAEGQSDEAPASPLVQKVSSISGCPVNLVGEWLLKCAVERGAAHYARPFRLDLPEDNSGVSTEEMAVALCLCGHSANPTYVRAAAQLLSSSRTDAPVLAELTMSEHVESVLLHIANAAGRIVPEAQPWSYLRGHLPARLTPPLEGLPHWSRFVSQTGVTPFGEGPSIKWLWRREPKQ